MIALEVCVDNAAGLSACETGGVDRIELCSALSVGGLTPSAGFIALATQSSVPCHVMIRPVVGGFIYADTDKEQMLADIAYVRDAGLAGIVIGALRPDGLLDHSFLRAAIAAAGPMEVTLHRAVDLMVDPVAAVEQAVALGFVRILTSGGAQTAAEGAAVIAAMQDRAGDRIQIMAGSGVTPDTVAELVTKTGVRHIHASCATPVVANTKVAKMRFGPDITSRTDPAVIRRMRAKLPD